MKIGIIGSGHVGLVTGACFSDLGNEVICMDQDVRKIKMLRAGEIPIFEPGLEELVKKNSRQGRLRFSSSFKETVKSSEIIFICVGTPPKDDGEADLSAIEHVAQAIAECLTEHRLIVEKSTVPVETGMRLYETIKENNKRRVSFDVASNPEFLREGSAVHDFFYPDRIVLGVESVRAKKLLLEVYKPFKAPFVVTDIRSAELIKHASNSFLATKISFINLVAQICARTGADVRCVAEGVGRDQRIGSSFLNAGVGFGGFCFPKDLAAFVKIGEQLGVSCNLLNAVLEINREQINVFMAMIRSALWNLSGKKIAMLGLAFKPDTDDMRFAPSLEIAERLKLEKVNINAYDPQAIPAAKSLMKNIVFSKTAYEACKGADAALVITEWREFRELDLKRLKKVLKRPIIIDGRNIYDPAMMKKLGFRYYSIGRKYKEHHDRILAGGRI